MASFRVFVRRSLAAAAAASLLVAILACAAQAAPLSALVSSGYTGQGQLQPGIGVASPLVGRVTVGWEFTAQSDLWVSELGFFDLGQDGLNISHDVGIWDQDQQLIVSATVSYGTAAQLIGEYRYASVAPVVLASGQTFVIGATVPIPLSLPAGFVPDLYPNDTLHIDPLGIVFDALIGLIAADRYFSDMDGSFLDPLAFPAEHRAPSPLIDFDTGQEVYAVYPYHFAPNFRFSEVPEPAAVALFAAGCLVLLRRRYCMI